MPHGHHSLPPVPCNIATPGVCSISRVYAHSCWSISLPYQLWNIFNLTPTCLLSAFFMISGFSSSLCSQLHHLSFGFSLQPLQLGPLSSVCPWCLHQPLHSDSLTMLYQWYPYQRCCPWCPCWPFLPEVCSAGVPPVHAIAGALAVHFFSSVLPVLSMSRHITYILSVCSALGLQPVTWQDQE